MSRSGGAIVHLLPRSHITRGYFAFLADEEDLSGHVAISRDTPGSWSGEGSLTDRSSASVLGVISRIVLASLRADKVIVHGLFEGHVIVALALMPWAWGRTHWTIWGGDLYEYRLKRQGLKRRLREAARAVVIRNAGHLVTYVEGDVDLARRWYRARGAHEQCLLYPGNTVDAGHSETLEASRTVVQVGNSADPENRHMEVIRRLAAVHGDFDVAVPLAYGDMAYRKRLLGEAQDLLGDRFKPQLGLVPADQYRRALALVDVAIFNHSRQQGMGNTITLLGLGKKVYLRPGTTHWDLLTGRGLTVFDSTGEIDLTPLDPAVAATNVALIREHFSPATLRAQWKAIFRA